MMNLKISISIITPVYKGNKYLPHLLKKIEIAVNNIKNNRVEWILVNDYPQEDILSLSTNLSNLSIKIINNSKNLGIQGARINGVKNSIGKYILFLDQDDEITPLSLKTHLDNIGKNDISVTNGFVENDRKDKLPIFYTNAQLNCVKDIKYFFYIGDIIVSPGMVLIKKNSIPESWINNSLKINGADDWLLWVLMLANKRKFSVNFQSTYIHKKNENNTSNNKSKMWDSTEEALKVFYKDQPSYLSLCKVFNRRIKLIKDFQLKNKNKFMLYLKNPDIAFYVIKYKLLKKYL